MFLRVDQVSGGNNANDPRPSSSPPLHACLATATPPAVVPRDDTSNSQSNATVSIAQRGDSQIASPEPFNTEKVSGFSGEILTIGRKNPSNVILNDKCVSRGHATIRLISNRHMTPSQPGDLASCFEGRIMMEFGMPSTPEEVHACETSSSGVVAMLSDKGSKFGTFVSVDEQLLRENQLGNNNTGGQDGDGDETGDDETDDGGGGGGMNFKPINYVELSEKQISAVNLLSASDAAESNNNDATMSLPKFQRLEANQSVPLLPLSHSHKNSNGTTSTSSSSSHVIILFGPQGSAIRLSLLPLQFTFGSRVTVKEPIISSLRYIGATHSTQWDAKKSTHLVTTELKATAKHIMAWACRRPVVTLDYVYALLKRSSPEENLPNEEDFNPPGETQLDRLASDSEPSIALRGYRIAVMADDDNLGLALSAGAEILSIHKEASTDSEQDFRQWWGIQRQSAFNDKMALVVVDSDPRKKFKWRQWLIDMGAYAVMTNPKKLAKAITANGGRGDLLRDTAGNVIEKFGGGADEGGQEKEDQKSDQIEEVHFETHADHLGESPLDNEEPPEIEAMAVNSPTKRNQEKLRDEQLSGQEEAQEDTGNENDEEAVQKGQENQVLEQAERPGQKRPREQQEKKPDRNDHQVVNKTKDASAPGNKKRKIRVEATDDERPVERKHLPTTDDGWFVAAPSKRTAFRKTRKEIEEMGENALKTSAETDIVSDLIIRSYVPPSSVHGSRTASNDKSKKKDFKRFRKNSVLRGYSSFTQAYASSNGNDQHESQASAPIRLVSVLPKESERQRQLEQQQQDLERDQEVADALFNDGGGGFGGGKSRGGRGSIQGFLSQSSTKRGRVRR